MSRRKWYDDDEQEDAMSDVSSLSTLSSSSSSENERNDSDSSTDDQDPANVSLSPPLVVELTKDGFTKEEIRIKEKERQKRKGKKRRRHQGVTKMDKLIRQECHKAHLMCYMTHLTGWHHLCQSAYLRHHLLSLFPMDHKLLSTTMSPQDALSLLYSFYSSKYQWQHDRHPPAVGMRDGASLMQYLCRTYCTPYASEYVYGFYSFLLLFCITPAYRLFTAVRLVIPCAPIPLKISRSLIDLTHDISSDEDNRKENHSLDISMDASRDSPSSRTRRKQRRSKGDAIEKNASKTRPDITSLSPAWLEIYLNGHWTTMDILKKDPYEAIIITHPAMAYVLAIDQEGEIAEVTWRYMSPWKAMQQQRRISTHQRYRSLLQWWTNTLQMTESNCSLDKDQRREEERASFDRQQQGIMPVNEKVTSHHRKKKTQVSHEEKEIQETASKDVVMSTTITALPTTLHGFKDHPQFVLHRHLLKYEVIYPADAVLCHFRDEPVYRREHVRTAHTRETWLKEGRSVKAGETPCKTVRAMMTQKRKRAQFLAGNSENAVSFDTPLFGEWQTDIYVPPRAVNGRVPRNQYGRVDLFKATMLPGGTVHVKLHGAGRVARDLGVDFAEAVTGFDFHGGWSIPVVEGIVVCEEDEARVRSAWVLKMAAQEELARRKLEKEALDRWRHLIRLALVRAHRKTASRIVTEDDQRTAARTKNKRRRRLSDSKDEQPLLMRTSGVHEHTYPATPEYVSATGMYRKTCPCGFIVEYEEF